MELIKLKDADIIELLGSPAAFSGGINVVPSSLFSWKIITQNSKKNNKKKSCCSCPTGIASLQTDLLSHLEHLLVADLVPVCPRRLFSVSHICGVTEFGDVCKKSVNFTHLKPWNVSTAPLFGHRAILSCYSLTLFILYWSFGPEPTGAELRPLASKSLSAPSPSVSPTATLT